MLKEQMTGFFYSSLNNSSNEILNTFLKAIISIIIRLAENKNYWWQDLHYFFITKNEVIK